MTASRKIVRSRHVVAGTLALLSLALYPPTPAKAQVAAGDQLCYAIADNNPPGVGAGGGRNNQDTLAAIDFDANTATYIAPVTDASSNAVGDIEALTSRPDFGELIAANANQLGRVDPLTGVFTPLGAPLTPYLDFDAIVIDRSGNQSRLLAVSKRRGNNPENAIVEVILSVDGNGQTTGIQSVTELGRIDPNNLPPGTRSIDGIAFSPQGQLFGVANDGPTSPQHLVAISLTGAVEDRGIFLNGNTPINDVEDLSFDLRGNLFATSGSNFGPFTDNGFLFPAPGGGQLAPATTVLDLSPLINEANPANPTIDFEASACLRAPTVGNLLLVKRITAITRAGNETRFTAFTNQQGDQNDNALRTATNRVFPPGIVQAPTPLQAGDLVEYTVYVYNPTNGRINNIVLCDPIRQPSVLQRDTIQFASPTSDLASPDLTFTNNQGFARSPLATADPACSAALNGGTQFLGGPPGPTGANGAGGGVVTNNFNLDPGELAATRFVIEVGQP